MNPSEEFRRFAGECRAMAKFTRSPESKAAWGRLAARWVRLAELNEKSFSKRRRQRLFAYETDTASVGAP